MIYYEETVILYMNKQANSAIWIPERFNVLAEILFIY